MPFAIQHRDSESTKKLVEPTGMGPDHSQPDFSRPEVTLPPLIELLIEKREVVVKSFEILRPGVFVVKTCQNLSGDLNSRIICRRRAERQINKVQPAQRRCPSRGEPFE